ncbi:MAG: 50S ribosomal protein L22 [Acidimicrobiia bacterium]|nr:50S ribosomal protein L22 [Acidimicrobiia bacterium]
MANATTLETRATLRYLQVSPFKIRQVLPLIRGRSVEEAERVLEVCERDAADHVLKVLESAIANAGHNHSIPPDELFVSVAYCDEGPTRNHGQARARGRYFRIRKRSSHLTIVVARLADEEIEARRDSDEAARGDRGRATRSRAERVRASRAAARREDDEHDHDLDQDHDHDHDEDDERGAAVAEAAGVDESTEGAEPPVNADDEDRESGTAEAPGDAEKAEESQ